MLTDRVEVTAYVKAELDRRFPIRLLLRSGDPADLLQALCQLRAGWAETIERLRAMPNGSQEQPAIETQRHLVFVHDSWWFRRCCLGSTDPFTAIGLASDFVPDQQEQGLDRAAAPSLDEVLAVRDGQGASYSVGCRR
jgi:hypothetical protein